MRSLFPSPVQSSIRNTLFLVFITTTLCHSLFPSPVLFLKKGFSAELQALIPAYIQDLENCGYFFCKNLITRFLEFRMTLDTSLKITSTYALKLC